MNLLFKEEPEFDEASRATAIQQILMALSYLHSNDIVHRDLKVENVVFSFHTSNTSSVGSNEIKEINCRNSKDYSVKK